MPADAIRFLFDHNVWKATAVGLRRHGIDVITAQDVGRNQDNDLDLLAFATAEGRMLVTVDTDFIALHSNGISHAGIAWCSDRKYKIGSLIAKLQQLQAIYSATEVIGHLEYL